MPSEQREKKWLKQKQKQLRAAPDKRKALVWLYSTGCLYRKWLDKRTKDTDVLCDAPRPYRTPSCTLPPSNARAYPYEDKRLRWQLYDMFLAKRKNLVLFMVEFYMRTKASIRLWFSLSLTKHLPKRSTRASLDTGTLCLSGKRQAQALEFISHFGVWLQTRSWLPLFRMPAQVLFSVWRRGSGRGMKLFSRWSFSLTRQLILQHLYEPQRSDTYVRASLGKTC